MHDLKNNEPAHSGVIVWFICNPVAANLLMVTILLVGLFSLQGLNIQGFPSIPANSISIDVTHNSGSAKQSEEGISIKIEQALQGVEGIKEIRSTSTTSGATIVVEKDSEYDLSVLNEEVTNKVNGVFGLPVDAEKPIITVQKMEDHALWLDVYGDVEQKSLQQAAQQFEQALLRLPSVSTVIKTGWKNPEISIEVKESQLQALGLSLQDIVDAIAAESFNEISGELRSENGLILLKADKQRYFKRDFADVVVKVNKDGSVIKLEDVALINDGFEESPNVLSRFQNKPAINFKVMVSKSANIMAIAKEAKALTKQWKSEGQLPESIDIAVLWDQSVFMKDRLTLLIKNGVIGVLLVMIILAIFLNIKVAFWVGMGLPICFSGAFIMMGDSFFALTLNDLTTFGFIIVLGILVDDAVVIGESIYTTRQQEGNTLNSTISGVKKVAVPTMFGVLTTIAVFYPMSFILGDLGKIFSLFALVAVACLIFSLIESKLILPAHLAHVDTTHKKTNNIFSQGFFWLQQQARQLLLSINEKLYQPAITQVLHYRYLALCLFISCFVLVIGMVFSGKVGVVFFPNIQRDIIEINYSAELGNGASVSHTQADKIEKITSKLNQEWQDQFPNTEPVIRFVQVQVEDDLNGYAVIELNTDTNRPVTTAIIEKRLRESLLGSEGIRQLNIQSSASSVNNFSLKILADNKDELTFVSDKIISFLQQQQGVADIENDLLKGQPQLEFNLTAKGRALGITTADLALQIRQGFYGAEVQRIQRGKNEVKVFVRYPAKQRHDVTNLFNTNIRTSDGTIVPLSEVAITKRIYTVKDIKHVNGRNAATITAKIDKTIISPSKVMETLNESILLNMGENYPNVEFLIAGESAEMEKTLGSMITIFGLSIFLIYILVAIPLKSYSQPLIIMSAIPFGILGAILGHWFINTPISILSLLGILALSGVVVNNSLLLVSSYNELCLEGNDIKTAISKAGSQRLRAILLTSITTFAGLASLLQEKSEQAAYLIPAAASLAYGILFSTLITLVLVPVLLVVFDDIKRVRIWGWNKLMSSLFPKPSAIINLKEK